MPNFKVFQDQASQLLSQVSNPTAGCLLSTVHNSTAGCLLSQVSNPTAGSLIATVHNSTAACLLTQVSNPTAGSLIATVHNSTAACLLTQVSNPTAGSLIATVHNSTAACLLSQVSNPTAGSLIATVHNSTAACLLETLGDRSTLDTSETTVANAGATAASTTRTVLPYSQYTFSAYNDTNATQTVQLQLSTDGTNFINDGASKTIAAAGTGFFAANFFTKYARLLITADATTTATIVVRIQAQV